MKYIRSICDSIVQRVIEAVIMLILAVVMISGFGVVGLIGRYIFFWLIN